MLVTHGAAELNQTAAELQQQYGVQVQTIAKDLFELQAPFEVHEEVQTLGIQIDALVNDAGRGHYGAFPTTDIPRELDIIQLNTGAYVTFTKLHWTAASRSQVLWILISSTKPTWSAPD